MNGIKNVDSVDKKNIIIAEDDSAISEVLTIVLQEAGYSVHLVSSYDEILPMVGKKHVGLVLLDVWFNGKNSADLCKQIKLNPTTKNIPVIILSASSELETIAKQVHADDVLAKPFEIDALVEKVKNYLS
jgi:DNA-binding response OmpR family regulator